LPATPANSARQQILSTETPRCQAGLTYLAGGKWVGEPSAPKIKGVERAKSTYQKGYASILTELK
jgi:hypothetical protein